MSSATEEAIMPLKRPARIGMAIGVAIALIIILAIIFNCFCGIHRRVDRADKAKAPLLPVAHEKGRDSEKTETDGKYKNKEGNKTLKKKNKERNNNKDDKKTSGSDSEKTKTGSAGKP